MPPSDLETVAEVYRAFDSRDFDAIGRLFDADIDINQAPELPWGGRHHGHAGAVEFFTTLLAHVDSRVSSEQLFTAGEDVVQIGRTVGKTIPGGIAFDIPEVHIWHLRAGRVVGFDAYIDTPAMVAALQGNSR